MRQFTAAVLIAQEANRRKRCRALVSRSRSSQIASVSQATIRRQSIEDCSSDVGHSGIDGRTQQAYYLRSRPGVISPSLRFCQLLAMGQFSPRLTRSKGAGPRRALISTALISGLSKGALHCGCGRRRIPRIVSEFKSAFAPKSHFTWADAAGMFGCEQLVSSFGKNQNRQWRSMGRMACSRGRQPSSGLAVFVALSRTCAIRSRKRWPSATW